MKFRHSSGAVAPLAMIFAFVSLLITVAYLGTSTSINSQERFRFAEITAQYIAEAGLNKEAADYLPYLAGADTTLVGETGVNFGEDTQGNSMGKYKNVLCGTQYAEASTRKEFYGFSTGEVSYETPNGKDVTVERTASLIMTPIGFEEFMYFTNDEEPFGPNAGAYVSFGNSDVLEGRVHSNSPTVTFSNYGCPEFLGSLSVTEPISYEGDTSCLDDMVDDDGESIIDTVSTIVYPPDNSADILRANAKRTFTADDLITFVQNRKDTLIMTEIEFEETGGYYATQWWYLIPPVAAAPPEIDFLYDFDDGPPGFPPVETSSLRLVRFDEDEEYLTDAWVDGEHYDNALQLWISGRDIDGNSVSSLLANFSEGDQIEVESQESNKIVSFELLSTTQTFGSWIFQINTDYPITYQSTSDIGFINDEEVTLRGFGDAGEPNVNVPFNAFEFGHNHENDGQQKCSARGFHHFDYRYWLCDDRYDPVGCKEEETDKSYVYSDRTFYSYTGPEVIYVKGGPALVHGTINGQYTVVTDDSVEYRRHDSTPGSPIYEQIWGNIWIIGDLRYEDSYSNGAVIHPDDGGTNNVLGLVAGGNVIIANTRENGARNRYQGINVVINGAVMALHGAFISHYWQNSVQSAQCPSCAVPNASQPWFSLGDGRGGHRNPVLPETSGGNYTNNIDYRGFVHLWGSIVQQERGYMKRNAPCSNPIPGGDCYTSEDIGYDKNYNYDYNLIDEPPPYYPDQSTVDGAIVLRLKSYGLVTGE
tara:strand:- start:11348 stop:13627 length:2280 start_codon:yes stop_codon:yes gene_type:complete